MPGPVTLLSPGPALPAGPAFGRIFFVIY